MRERSILLDFARSVSKAILEKNMSYVTSKEQLYVLNDSLTIETTYNLSKLAVYNGIVVS